jgi:hypothetical protein
MILLIFIVLLVPIGVTIMALLLPMKIFFSTSGGSDRGAVLQGRIMLFNGLAGAGMNFDHGRMRAFLFLGSKQVAGFEVTAAAGKLRARRKAKAVQKRAKMPKMEKEKEVKPPAVPLSERFSEWQKQAGKYRKYASMIFGAIRKLVRIDYFRVRLSLGFSDPALTGKIVGILFAVNSILPKSCTIKPEWDFSKKLFAGEASLKLTFRNYLFWLYLIKFFLFFRKKPETSFAFTGQTLNTQEA